MSSANQQLTLQEVSEYVRTHIGEWLAKPPVVYEIELRERMVRVEEELRHQRELMKQGFDLMDRRFEAMARDNNKRFESMDKRFEMLTQRIDRFMFWSFGITIGMGSLVIAALKLL
uniref:Uncharacterized protein n=1 Tax=Candidatus Kentrum sp. FW TaxID=2126338 RepID=A0A450SGR4_9GAMM|nr:MAG: hypothetical protein BECKFW1821A_GA0114235_103516 [Candidatus Kentron sp. FW]VFJ57465.1 MAG: hypothetical protein BECKFW1821B_GA0114236_10348 [Candidatus Kentron sp. FW]